MLTVTEAASAHLRRILDEAGQPEDVVARFVREGSKAALRADTVKSGDVTFEHEGQTVLVADEAVSEMLADRTLDVQETEDGPQIKLV